MLATRIPEELNLRTFELGMISFRPDPAQFRTIAVYGDSLAFDREPEIIRLRGAERVSINDLGKENFIAHNVTSPLRRKVIETFQRYRTPLNMGIELPTIEAIKRFVAMGNGVALVPHLTVARELETGELVRVTVDELEMKRVLRLVHRRQATLSYAARAFLRTVRSMAQAARAAVLLPRGKGGLKARDQAIGSGHREGRFFQVAQTPSGSASIASDRFRAACPSSDPFRPFTMLRAGPGTKPAHRNRQARCQPDGCAVVRIRTE